MIIKWNENAALGFAVMYFCL